MNVCLLFLLIMTFKFPNAMPVGHNFWQLYQERKVLRAELDMDYV